MHNSYIHGVKRKLHIFVMFAGIIYFTKFWWQDNTFLLENNSKSLLFLSTEGIFNNILSSKKNKGQYKNISIDILIVDDFMTSELLE